MKKAICTIGLILSIIATIVLVVTWNIWFIVAALCTVGFASLELHYEGQEEWRYES